MKRFLMVLLFGASVFGNHGASIRLEGTNKNVKISREFFITQNNRVQFQAIGFRKNSAGFFIRARKVFPASKQTRQVVFFIGTNTKVLFEKDCAIPSAIKDWQYSVGIETKFHNKGDGYTSTGTIGFASIIYPASLLLSLKNERVYSSAENAAKRVDDSVRPLVDLLKEHVDVQMFAQYRYHFNHTMKNGSLMIGVDGRCSPIHITFSVSPVFGFVVSV